MQTRSNDNLPAFFTPYNVFSFADTKKLFPAPLDIYDFTFLHFHDSLEIGYCLEGTGICRVEEQQYSFKKGDVEIIFPFQQHLSRSRDGECSQWYWLNINPYSLMEDSGFSVAPKIKQMIIQDMGLCGIFSPEQYPEVTDLVEHLFREIIEHTEDRLYHAELSATYVYQLLICLTRLSRPLPKLKIERDRNISSLSPALEMISNGVRKGIVPSIEQLATACSMSVSNFRKVFHRVIGLAPKDYVTKCFLHKAQQLLLTTEKSITEICLETGFRDISGFNRQFLAKTQMTPSAFRRKYKKI